MYKGPDLDSYDIIQKLKWELQRLDNMQMDLCQEAMRDGPYSHSVPLSLHF